MCVVNNHKFVDSVIGLLKVHNAKNDVNVVLSLHSWMQIGAYDVNELTEVKPVQNG